MYEATAEGVSEERDNLQDILWDESFWWNRQISNRKSIILNTLDDMPQEAQEYRKLLESQNIKSLMAVPLISKDKIWGYMGIDMVKAYRSWSNVDLQWFSSLANIISICIELRKSELQAKEDRLALDHKKRFSVISIRICRLVSNFTIKTGYLIDINDKELEIFGLTDKNEVLGINLFDNPNIPQEIKEKLRARNDVDFSINYDFSKINKYIETQRKGVINLTTKVTTLL